MTDPTPSACGASPVQYCSQTYPPAGNAAWFELIEIMQPEPPARADVDQPGPNVDASARLNESVTSAPPTPGTNDAVTVRLALTMSCRSMGLASSQEENTRPFWGVSART